MKINIIFVLAILTVVAMVGVPAALAIPAYKDDFNAKYNTTGTRIDQCILCHVNADPFSNPVRNSYGIDLDNQLINLTNTPSNANQSTVNQSLTNIEPLDSDKDGFINIDEIHNLTFPGNASDHPAIVTPTANVTANVTASPTANVTANVTASPTANVTANVTASPTANVTANVTASPTANVTANVTASPTANVTVSPIVTGTVITTRTPAVTGTPTAVPEFPTMILPIAAVMGLMLLLLYRRKE